MLQLTEAQQNSGYSVVSVDFTVSSLNNSGINVSVSAANLTRIVELIVTGGKPVMIYNGSIRIAVISILDGVVTGQLVQTVDESVS